MASKKKATAPPPQEHLFPCGKPNCTSCREHGETVWSHLMTMTAGYFTLRELTIVQNIKNFSTDEISELVRISTNVLAREGQKKNGKH